MKSKISQSLLWSIQIWQYTCSWSQCIMDPHFSRLVQTMAPGVKKQKQFVSNSGLLSSMEGGDGPKLSIILGSRFWDTRDTPSLSLHFVVDFEIDFLFRWRSPASCSYNFDQGFYWISIIFIPWLLQVSKPHLPCNSTGFKLPTLLLLPMNGLPEILWSMPEIKTCHVLKQRCPKIGPRLPASSTFSYMTWWTIWGDWILFSILRYGSKDHSSLPFFG